jgi:hypothetical protein
MTETAQCESCGSVEPLEDMETETVPGATLFFCAECAEKPYRKQVL